MAIQLVAQIAGGAAGAFTTAPIDTRLANLIVILAGAGNNSDPTPTNSRGDGASYTGLTSVHYNGGGYQTSRLWYKVYPLTDAAHTFTLVQAAQSPCLAVMAFSGVSAAATLDQEGTPYTANSNTWPLPSITPGQDKELIIVGAVGGLGQSIDSGFTGLFGTSAGTWQPTMAYLIETMLQTKAPTITPASYSAVAAKMITFKAAGASFNPAWARAANQLIGGQ